MRRWLRRLKPRSLRARLVLGVTLLATSAVLLCQAAGLALLHSWLTDQVDGRLSRFQLVPQLYKDVADGRTASGASARTGGLPSDYRVYFYDRGGHRIAMSLSGDGGSAGPRLPKSEAELGLKNGRPATVAATDGGSTWRVIARTGTDGTRVVVALPLKEVDEATSRMLWFSLAVGVAVAAGVVLFGTLAVRLGLRPLVGVERTARRIAEGELELSVSDRHAVTEVGHLSRALNTMLDRLRTALRRTEASEQRLRHFLADVGHELRTPLTSLQGFAELLVQEPEMSLERRQEAQQLIVRNADRMSRLIESLSQLARLGEVPATRWQPVDLLSLVADGIAAVAVRHPGRSIGLGTLADPEDDARVNELDVVDAVGDPHQLAQILSNLLTNACVHTPTGTHIQVRVGTLRVRPHGPGTTGPGRTSANAPLIPGTRVCVVEVADDGAGLAESHARRVFERFYRVDSTERAAAAGSGLGLAIAAGAAEANGGRLELEARPGEGCTFRLLLPYQPAAAATAAPALHTCV
ncbi:MULTISPECIES: sensor histidine kinase [Streptomyces]|uniref:histidine kinase n=2 Tax=Streptomyces TaxID=1883 RepID=C9ZA00_STRSW|nr:MULTISPECIES: HAMP domain-containing sensor histidine kinase [Streptomyces]MBP5871186.1 HAMP domain-containing histidine kinase [Streptomyces sp. LBUM 1485]MBP5904778.1 HAMP domain-containing histidine kinase [Streptomyces sp. LBUM 1478]MBP5933031.1 HAMP domain-containing histidine kinase [Streptomyces sp. LBUM 1479]KFG09459.1 histidine kinase [Streptomyces scabiei]KND44724.1 histidine kinase [Streptomyces stelliscabiei]